MSSRRSQVFLAGQAVSLLGDGLAILAIPLLVLQLTRSPVAAALASAPRTIGYLLVGLPSGPIVDRCDPWSLLVAMDIVRCVSFVVLYLLTLTHIRSVAAILALAVLAAAAGVFFESALAIAVKDVFSGPDLIRANSFLEMSSQTSVVLGPALVGALAAGVGLGTALLINASTFAVSLGTLFALGRDRTAPVRRPPALRRPMRAEFRAGLAYLARTRVILTLTIMQTVINLCLAVEKLIIYLATRTLGESAWMVSLALIGGGMGGVAGAFTARWILPRLGALRLVAVSIALIGAALVLIGAVPGIGWLAGSNLVLVWATVVSSIVIRTLRQQIVPRSLLGRVTGTVRTIYLAVTPIGAVIAGVVTAALAGNPRPVFIGAGTLILATTGIAWAAALRGLHHAGAAEAATPVPR